MDGSPNYGMEAMKRVELLTNYMMLEVLMTCAGKEEDLRKCFLENLHFLKLSLSFTFRDIPLKPEILDNIEVMLGPCTSEGEKAIVEALLKGFKNYKIKDSLFKGKIRRNK